MISIPDNQRIVESDFLNGKPQKSFFDKINALTEVLAGKTPEAPTKKPESAPAALPNTAPQAKTEPPVSSTESIEGKTKLEIENIVFTQAASILTSYKKDLEKITDKATKAFLEPILEKI